MDAKSVVPNPTAKPRQSRGEAVDLMMITAGRPSPSSAQVSSCRETPGHAVRNRQCRNEARPFGQPLAGSLISLCRTLDHSRSAADPVAWMHHDLTSGRKAIEHFGNPIVPVADQPKPSRRARSRRRTRPTFAEQRADRHRQSVWGALTRDMRSLCAGATMPPY